MQVGSLHPLGGKLDGVENLKELRILNLSGNVVSSLDGLRQLESLTELNLRRNKLTRLVGSIVIAFITWGA